MNSAKRHWRARALAVAAGLLIVAGLALTGSLFAAGADAYTLHGFKWKGPVVGYSVDDVRVEPYADEAMRLWSEPSMLRTVPGGSEIRIVVGTLSAPTLYEGQPAQANVQHSGEWITSCEVRLDPVYFFNLDGGTRQAVLTHELGHCMGLNHSKEPSIMQSPYLYAFSADDAAAMRSLYGQWQVLNLGFRSVVVGLASGE
jgi:hypothetical protein